MLKGPLSFIARNGAAITALASLCVACLSLYITIDSQRHERAYKELLIRPHLALSAATQDFSVTLRNDGLGPAKIVNVVYFTNGACLQLADDEVGPGKRFSDSNYNKATYDMVEKIMHKLESMPWPDKQFIPNATHHAEVLALPVLNTVIPANGQFIVFKMDSALHSTLLTNLTKLPRTAQMALREDFITVTASLPIRMKYCSMSGEYCYSGTRPRHPELPCDI